MAKEVASLELQLAEAKVALQDADTAREGLMKRLKASNAAKG
jgi:hypothetical protein